jgi:hypothetical protein
MECCFHSENTLPLVNYIHETPCAIVTEGREGNEIIKITDNSQVKRQNKYNAKRTN